MIEWVDPHFDSTPRKSHHHFTSPTHKRTEGQAPVWGSEFTAKAAKLQDDSVDFAARLSVQIWDLRACAVKPSPLEQLSIISNSHRKKNCTSAAKKKLRSWLCTQERWNPEVVNIFGPVARLRRATAGSSHDDAHPDNSALHTGKLYLSPLHNRRFVLLVLRQRRGAAATTWAPQSSTCEIKRSAPRASA